MVKKLTSWQPSDSPLIKELSSWCPHFTQWKIFHLSCYCDITFCDICPRSQVQSAEKVDVAESVWKAVLAQYTHNECLLAFTEVIQHWPQTPQSCCTKTPSFTLGEWGRSLKVNIWDETSTRAKGRNYRRKVHVCRRDVGQDRCAHWHGSSF